MSDRLIYEAGNVRLSPIPACLCLTVALAQASASPISPRSLGLPPSITIPVLETILQDFVTAAYGKAFLDLGVENDFDHGHLLIDRKGRPFAVLFHTQELTSMRPKTSRNPLDPAARNWIEWIDSHKVEDARKYARTTYPATATWDWFKLERLPLLEAHHTILDIMLDPALLGRSVADSRQWVFTRSACARDHSRRTLRVVLPTKAEICLSLSPY